MVSSRSHAGLVVDVHLAAAAPTSRRQARFPARVARMLAIAHHLQAAIDRGQLFDRAHAARCLGMTRARLTQICDLLLLAPDIQEELLFLETVDGLEPFAERELRPIARYRRWAEQREAWNALLAASELHSSRARRERSPERRARPRRGSARSQRREDVPSSAPRSSKRSWRDCRRRLAAHRENCRLRRECSRPHPAVVRGARGSRRQATRERTRGRARLRRPDPPGRRIVPRT